MRVILLWVLTRNVYPSGKTGISFVCRAFLNKPFFGPNTLIFVFFTPWGPQVYPLLCGRHRFFSPFVRESFLLFPIFRGVLTLEHFKGGVSSSTRGERFLLWDNTRAFFTHLRGAYRSVRDFPRVTAHGGWRHFPVFLHPALLPCLGGVSRSRGKTPFRGVGENHPAGFPLWTCGCRGLYLVSFSSLLWCLSILGVTQPLLGFRAMCHAFGTVSEGAGCASHTPVLERQIVVVRGFSIGGNHRCVPVNTRRGFFSTMR